VTVGRYDTAWWQVIATRLVVGVLLILTSVAMVMAAGPFL
jgi:hypothetical protein